MNVRDPESISTTLLGRVRASDDGAWRQLVQVYTPLIHYWARKSNLSEADAADVTQDVFIAVHRQIDSFDRHGQGGTFRGWLRQITRFKICDSLRRNMGRPVAEGGSDAQLQIDLLTDPISVQDNHAEETGITHRALEMIKPDFTEATWRAFELTAIEGRPINEVATELKLSLGAVYIARTRIFKRLREELDGVL